MTDYESDSVMQEVHDEMYQEEEKKPSGSWQNLDDTTRMWVGLFVGAVLLFWFLGRITVQTAIVIIGIGAVVLYLMRGEVRERKELTWLECQIRLYDLLVFLQEHPIGTYKSIPKGEVRVHPIGRKQWYEGKGFKRSFKVTIYNQVLDIEEYYFAEIDIFTGDILTFRESPEGVRGDETKDIKLLPRYDQIVEKRASEYMGKAWKK